MKILILTIFILSMLPMYPLGEATASVIDGQTEISVLKEHLAKRGQTYRHFYNNTSGSFTYMSDYCVLKSNVHSETEWVLASEYPVRFVIKYKDNSTFFYNSTELIHVLSDYNETTLWGIGIEGFSGVMAFYLNFEDSINGHGQYLWYPRLSNGSLPKLPLYQVYPHIYVKLGITIYDHFFIPTSNVRNRIVITNNSEYLSVFFTFQSSYLGKTFQFQRGLKYNLTTHTFHTINHFKCLDQTFDDVGFAYEIDANPVTRGTWWRPERFILYPTNQTIEPVEVTIYDIWNASHYLGDFYSRLSIICKNGESWTLDFSDMEAAGFTEKYLNIHDQKMPDNSTRRVLRVGMYGYGAYSAGDTIRIDPTYSETMETTTRDFYIRRDSTGPSYIFYDIQHAACGYVTTQYSYRGYVAFDSGITEEIVSIDATVFQASFQWERLEAGPECASWRLYDAGDADEYWDTTEGNANPAGCFAQSTYYNDTDMFNDVWDIGNDLTIKTYTNATAGLMTQAWMAHHNGAPASRQFIPLIMDWGDDMDAGTTDDVNLKHSTYETPANRMTLNFTYSLVAPANPIITDWFETSLLVDPEIPIAFYGTVNDTDSSYDALTVVLYYSNDTFDNYNVSESMLYDETISEDIYRFICFLESEDSYTRYHYYYTANDSQASTRSPTGESFYSVRWSLDEGYVEPDNPDVPIQQTLDEWMRIGIALFPWALFIGLACGLILYLKKHFNL